MWSHSFSDLHFASTNPPAVLDGKVYIVAGPEDSTTFFVFNSATGAQLFQRPIPSKSAHYLAPTISNGVVYTNGGSQGGMYAFDITTGVQKFFSNVLPRVDGWTPALDNQYAYVYAGGNLLILDNQTGQLVKSIADPSYFSIADTINSAPVIGTKGLVYAGDSSTKIINDIVAFDTVNNRASWSIDGSFTGNPAYANGILYSANNYYTAAFEARDESNGQNLWGWRPDSTGESFVSNVLVTNNLAFVSTDTTTYAIDLTTHRSVWSYAASGSLALSANGVLYIKNELSVTAINLQ